MESQLLDKDAPRRGQSHSCKVVAVRLPTILSEKQSYRWMQGSHEATMSHETMFSKEQFI